MDIVKTLASTYPETTAMFGPFGGSISLPQPFPALLRSSGSVDISRSVRSVHTPKCPKSSSKAERTWSLKLVNDLYERTKNYSLAHLKIIDALTLDDFAVIAAGLEKSPEACMLKVREGWHRVVRGGRK